MKQHENFILQPITNVLKDVVVAKSGVNEGIELYPLYDYIMQTAFLKMTGFQEQKLKCIRWILATDDFEYRFNKFGNNAFQENYSTYDDKNRIFSELYDFLKKYNQSCSFSEEIKKTIRDETKKELRSLLWASGLYLHTSRSYTFFDKFNIKLDNFAHITRDKKIELFTQNIQVKHEFLYKHRNRCAHNTLSYQNNLPTLSTLANENYEYDNYYIRFMLLALIDKLFIHLFKSYLDLDDFIIRYY